jgi:hypothetical protein
MAAIGAWTRWIFLAYFVRPQSLTDAACSRAPSAQISHIPITLFFDLQAVLPAEWYPTPVSHIRVDFLGTVRVLTGAFSPPMQLRQMVREYALAFNDPFMLGDEIFPWFNSFVTCEARAAFVCNFLFTNGILL